MKHIKILSPMRPATAVDTDFALGVFAGFAVYVLSLMKRPDFFPQR